MKKSDSLIENFLSLFDDRILYTGAVLGSLFVSGFIYAIDITFLSNIFSNKFGIFSNLTIIFYALAAIATAFILKSQHKKIKKTIEARWKEAFRKWGAPALLILLCLVMICEELKWLLPFFSEDLNVYSVDSIKAIIIAAMSTMPENAGLDVTMAIAFVRFLIVASLVYGLGFLIYYRIPIAAYLDDPRNETFLFYGGLFCVFIILSLLTGAYGFKGSRIFEECTEFCAALSVLSYQLTKKEFRNTISSIQFFKDMQAQTKQ